MFALLAMGQSAFAYDFSATSPSGHTLYYSIGTYHGYDVVSVVWPNASATTATDTWTGYTKPTGDLVIPVQVTYNDVTYYVLYIGTAFYGCTGLTSVSIPNYVIEISVNAFNGCTGLTSVTIPNASIGTHAFQNCTGLTSVTIGRGVYAINNYAFYGCTNLDTIVFNAESCRSIGQTDVFPTGVTKVIFGDTVGHIPSYLCKNLSLQSVTIPNSVTSIGAHAFLNCSNLNYINYTGTIAQWCNISFGGALSSAHSLNINGSPVTNLVIPNSVTSIGNYAFTNCTGLSSVTIGSSVTSIDTSAFYGCTGLSSVTIPNSVASIGVSAFQNCSGMTSITIPSSVTSIGDNAFSGCTALTTAVVDMTNIPSNLFYGCNHITHLTLGSNVQSIASNAFTGCDAVLCLTSNALVPPSASSNPFTNFNTSIPVYVPCSSVEAYRNAAYWGFFSNIQCSNEGIDDLEANEPNVYSIDGRIVVEGATDEVRVLDMMGRSVRNNALPAGVYMVKVGDYPARKVVVIR